MSDLHGNLTATKAVVADAESVGVDEWWVLGDIVALGPNPVAVLEYISDLPGLQVIPGNTERYVLDGDRPFPGFDDVREHPSLLERLAEVAASFAWTRGMITQAGWYDWLQRLPANLRMELPDGTHLLAVHASPSSDDGPGISTTIADAALADLLSGCDADIVIGGHTHDVTDRTLGDVRAINLGSVSNSSRADRAATYSILNFDSVGHHFEPRVVDYNHDAELAAIDAAHHPAGDYIRQFHHR